MADARSKAPGGSKGSARSRRTEGAPRSEPAPVADQVCPVAFCPVGLALTTVRQARPEAVEHLLAGARELLLAALAVVDARAADAEGAPRSLERIDIA